MTDYERLQRDSQKYVDELYKAFLMQFQTDFWHEDKDERIEEKIREALTQSESEIVGGKKS